TDAAKLPDMDIWDLKHHFELAVGLAAPGCDVQPAANGAGWAAVQQEAVWGSAALIEADAPKWAGPLFGLEVKIAIERPVLARYREGTRRHSEREVVALLSNMMKAL